MNRYRHVEPGGERGEIDEVYESTEEEILDMHWDYWKEEMEKKYGKDHELITKENCIASWCNLHWAWKVE